MSTYKILDTDLFITTSQSQNQLVMCCQTTVEPRSDYFPLASLYGSTILPIVKATSTFLLVRKSLAHIWDWNIGKINAEAKEDIGLVKYGQERDYHRSELCQVR